MCLCQPGGAMFSMGNEVGECVECGLERKVENLLKARG